MILMFACARPPAQRSEDAPEAHCDALAAAPGVGVGVVALAVDTAAPPVACPADTGAPPPLPPLAAYLSADTDEGDFPLAVTFDPAGSELGSGLVGYAWDFGDGATATDAGPVVHTYVGEGTFAATLTLTDEQTGETSVAEVEIDVDEPGCPREDNPEDMDPIDDGVDSLSGVAASRLAPDVYWVHEDEDAEVLLAVDEDGEVLSEQELPRDIDDLEDVATVVDALTGTPWLFLADTGDNDAERRDAVIWVVEEPDPWVDGELDPLRIEIEYPDGPVDVEALMVDPLTMDVYLLTKEDDPTVFVKRAPHDDEGPIEVEELGTWSSLDFTATGADVAPDGLSVVVRGYSSTARWWPRDGYEPLEEAFDDDGCSIGIRSEPQGEGVAFTADGEAIVTVSEGPDPSISYVEL